MDGAAGAFTKPDMKYCDGGDMRAYEDKYGYRHKDTHQFINIFSTNGQLKIHQKQELSYSIFPA
jgi:1,4-dihydroxy-2-naphthoyl-CoA synthase